MSAVRGKSAQQNTCSKYAPAHLETPPHNKTHKNKKKTKIVIFYHKKALYTANFLNRSAYE